MDRNKIISILINIGKGIRKCYQEIINIELDEQIDNKFQKIVEIYKEISQYRQFEDQYFSRLEDCCKSEKDIDKLYEYINDFYYVKDGIIPGYEKYLDYNIEVRRILERVNEDIDVLPVEIDSDTEEVVADLPLEKEFLISEEALLAPLIETETTVAFIHKIDSIINNNEESFFTREQLLQFKYDMIFLNRKLEDNLINDYCILSLPIVDAKMLLANASELSDERVEMAYDNIREFEILKLVDDLSQRRNQKDLFKQNLRYMIIELLAESIGDVKLAEIIGKIKESVDDSYSESISDSRNKIYEILVKKFRRRISDYKGEMIVEEIDYYDEYIELEDEPNIKDHSNTCKSVISLIKKRLINNKIKVDKH